VVVLYTWCNRRGIIKYDSGSWQLNRPGTQINCKVTAGIICIHYCFIQLIKAVCFLGYQQQIIIASLLRLPAGRQVALRSSANHLASSEDSPFKHLHYFQGNYYTIRHSNAVLILPVMHWFLF
jgi:hypothetical protein